MGAARPRREDRALLTGHGCFSGDVALEAPLFLAFARSPVAAGNLKRVDLETARACPGVVAAYAGADVAGLGALSVNAVMALARPLPFPVLAQTQVTHVGQPVAAVLADSPEAALDGAEAVVMDIAEAPFPAPEPLAEKAWRAGDPEGAFAAAATVVEVTIRHPRLAPSPMEPRSISVACDAATGGVTVWHGTQTPHRSRSELAAILSLDPALIRVIARDVGGAFGMKASLYPEEVCAVWAARTHRRAVRWQATRSEDFLSATHGRGLTSRGRLALDAQGRFTALEADIAAPLGPWLPNSALIPALNAGRVLPCAYDIAAVAIRARAQVHALGPTGIYRGAGRPEAVMLMERLVDKAARKTGRDPLELRRANLLPATALPHRTATGNTLDSGYYAAALLHLAQAADLPALRAEQTRRRAAGELIGIGIAFYVENSGEGWESARVTLTQDGAEIASGSSSQGHGRETAFARIAADALGIEAARITVQVGDTATCPPGIGALASRATAIGGSAIVQACQQAQARREAGATLPVTVEARYENGGMAWGYGAMLIQMSIDRETGQPLLERAICVDDTGIVIDPAQVDGQVRGGFAQGLGEALMERIVHDADGQLLTGSLMDYALPRATDMPALEIHKTETPSPMNLLGAKGVGEAGTIAAPPAILSAALDALAPLGVHDLDMPLTPETLWRAITAAQKDPR
jgi:carbon-monoxide dehydrogenase large subunit